MCSIFQEYKNDYTNNNYQNLGGDIFMRIKKSDMKQQIPGFTRFTIKARKFLASMIILAIIIESLPLNAVFATADERTYKDQIRDQLQMYEETEGTIDGNYNPDDVTIIEEVQSKRTANSKTFLKSDGTFEVYYFEDVINYLDDSGDWIEIDNTLVDDGTSYINTNNIYSLQLPKNLSESSKIRFSMNDYQIDWSIPDINTSYVTTSEPVDISFMPKTTGFALYNQVFPNVNLEYILKGNEVKENIILTNYQENFSFEIDYTVAGLNLSNDNGKLMFSDENNNVIMYFNNLYMYDINYNESSDIEVNYVQIDESTYKVTIYPNDEWLQHADYPVVIDPSIVLSTSNSSMSYKTLSNNSTSTPSMLKIDNDDEVISRGYIYLPTNIIPENTVLTYAHVRLNITSNNGSNENQLVMREVLSPSYEYLNAFSNNFTYSRVIDYQTIDDTTSGTIFFDISTVYQEWYSEAKEYGVLELKFLNEELSWWGELWNLSREIQATPSIVIGYRETTGLYDYMTYNSQETGTSSVAYVQDYSGQLTVFRSDINFVTELQSLSLSMYHNQKDKNINIGYGYGWRSNYNIEITYDSELSQYYTRDGSGSIVYYTSSTYSGSSSSYSTSEYIAEDGSQTRLLIEKYLDSIISIKLVSNMTYFYFNTYLVDGSYLLSSITDESGNLGVNVYYLSTSSKCVSSIVDSSGNRIVITYSSGKAEFATLELYQPDSSYNIVEKVDYDYFSYTQITYEREFVLCEDGSIMIVMTPLEETIYTKKLDQIDYYKNYNTSTLTLDDSLSYFTSQYSYDISNIADSVGDKIVYSYNIINQVSEIHRYYKNVLQSSVQYAYSFRSTVISDVFSDEFVQYNFDSFGHTTLITNSYNESQSFRYMNQFSENDVNSNTNTFQPNYNQNNKLIYDSGLIDNDITDAVYPPINSISATINGDYSKLSTVEYDVSDFLYRGQGYTLSGWSTFYGTPITTISEYDRAYQVSIQFVIETIYGDESYSETMVFDSSVVSAQNQSKSFIVPSNMKSATLIIEYQGMGYVEFNNIVITKGMVGTQYSLNENGQYSKITENYQTTNIDYSSSKTYTDGSTIISFDDIVTITKSDGSIESMSYSDFNDLHETNNVKVLTTYNSDGQKIASKTIFDSGISVTNTIVYNSISNNQYLESVTDYQGNSTEYDYDTLTGMLQTINSSNNVEINYEYYSDGMIYKVSVGDNCTTTNECYETTYVYDETSNLLVKIIIEDGYSYNIYYDPYDRIDSISIENNEYANTLIQ